VIIAGTGHRPKYCPCEYNENHPWLVELRSRLSYYLDMWKNALDEPVIIRTGMAIGWDTWLAEEALNQELEVHAFVPFPGQESRWPSHSQERYRKILDKTANVEYSADEYHRSVFFDRDIAMITGIDKVVALLNPEATSGGTFYTVQQAKKAKLEVVNFWQD